MASFCFDFISILMLSTAWAAQNFVPVSVCPRDLYSWNLESGKKNCQGDTPNYLCAAIENQVGNFGEICTKFGLTPANKCAVLNEQTHNLDSVDCKADSGCPAQPYIPSVLWQYQICFKDFYGTTTTLAPSTTQTITTASTTSRPEDVGSGGVAIAVVFILISVVVLVVVLAVFYRGNQFGFRDKLCHTYHTASRASQSQESQQRADVEKDAAPGQLMGLLLPADVENDAAPGQSIGLLLPEEHDKNEQKKEKMKELLKYLDHILKQELGINDLKEKVVINSKSLNEHFSEKLREDLKSVKNPNDYNRLDTSLVFALLRNFCEGIKAPSRGWDYEPPDDETQVGADIERIRFMWNKYCDNDLEFKHLDDVYNRMKQKYGTVAVSGDDAVRKSPSKNKENIKDLENNMEKIQSIKLNPDCSVEKGIVITECITSALKILKSRNVVILKGAIGCGKTYALKAIQNHFQKAKWETAWVEPEKIEGEISHEKPTILICDNLFGKFGSCIFSQDAVNKTEKVLKEIETSKQETKVVIGIHTHIYDEVKKNLRLSFLHQKNITVEMDNLSEAETLLILKEQTNKGHCKMDPNCWFKTVGFQSVLDKLAKNQGHIGSPFLSMMYCNQHELFSDDAFSVNPVRTLEQHIEKMKHDSTITYYCLVYLMCVQQHNLEEEPKMWAGQISAEISKSNLMEVAKTSHLLQVDNERATLAHELLTTVLFKSAVVEPLISLQVLRSCDGDVFPQLLRPTDCTYSDLYMEFDLTKHSRDVSKLCAYRLARKYKNPKSAHPLMTVELVKDKYLHYLTNEPKKLYK